MTLARLSVVLYVFLHLLCVRSDEGVAIPDDETLLIQYQTTMDHRSSDDDATMSEHLAAELLSILTTSPDVSKVGPVQLVCKQLSTWFAPLTKWLDTTMNQSHQNIDAVLHESLVIQEHYLKVLRNTTNKVNIRLTKIEDTLKKIMITGGPFETRVMQALAPMDLGSQLHLDKYKVVKPGVGKNETFYSLLMKGLFKKLNEDIHKGGLKARMDVTWAIKEFEDGLETGVTDTEKFWQTVTARLEHLTGTLSNDMAIVMPAECSSVYEEPLTTANKTIDAIENHLQIKLKKLAMGIREAAGILRSLTHDELNGLRE